MVENSLQDIGPDKSLLLVDDDEPFLRRLAKAMEKRGFEVETAQSVAAGKAIATARTPAYAVVDLRLEDGNGLEVVEVLRDKREDCRVIVLTGYGAIATAVAAVKIGAADYLAKPADAQDVMNALLAPEGELPPPPENPMLTGRLSISASILSSLALARITLRNSAADISSSPRALRCAFTAVRRKVMLPTPGISTGYWNARNTPSPARSSGFWRFCRGSFPARMS